MHRKCVKRAELVARFPGIEVLILYCMFLIFVVFVGFELNLDVLEPKAERVEPCVPSRPS